MTEPRSERGRRENGSETPRRRRRLHARHRRKSEAASLALSLVVIGAGVWLFLGLTTGVAPSVEDYWPVFLVLAALGAGADYLWFSRRSRSAGAGALLLGLGLLAFAFTLGEQSWEKTLRRLPMLPLIFGGSLLVAAWASKKGRPTYVQAGGLLVALGLLALLFGLEAFRSLVPWFPVLLPLGLIALGGFLLWRIVQRRSRSASTSHSKTG